MKKTIAISILALVVLSCARVEIRKVKAMGDEDQEGIRFWRPWPYLWITADKDGNCGPTITYLPNMVQEYIIIPHVGIGSATMHPTLTDGWNLTAFDSAVDTKVPQTLMAVGSLISAIKPGGLLVEDTATEKNALKLGPGLYKILFERNGDITDIITGFEPVLQVVDEENKVIPCKPVENHHNDNDEPPDEPDKPLSR